MVEIWKKIENYDYEVSTYGNVRNLKTNRILKPIKTFYGYRVISLRRNKKSKMFLLHRLVACAFIENEYNKSDVNHIDGIKYNNCVDNLEWVTKDGNQIHSHLTLGNKDKSRKEIYQINKYTDEIINIFRDSYLAQKITGVWQQNINKCALGKAKTAGGFKWKYN